MTAEDRTPRVFVSSASGALATYRTEAIDVCHRLGFVPVHMEAFAAERVPPLDVCRRMVEGSDIFVLLLAHRYGARPPGEDRSYTELEYGWALAAEMPLMPFIVDPELEWKPADIDEGPDREALRRLIARVNSSHIVRTFGDPPAFRENLLLALQPYQHVTTPQPAGTGREWTVRAPAFHATPSYVGGAPFTGRHDDLRALDAWGRSDDPVMVVEAIGGTGKSALTWEWAERRGDTVIDDLAGRLWWSFYEGSASMTRFLREVLYYASDLPRQTIGRMQRQDLSEEVAALLRSRPYLLVLDGFERLLAAYHRFDPSKLRDDEVAADKRSLIEPHAHEVTQGLITAGPSKVLISTRLMPDALDGRFGRPAPGVRHMRLPGLTDADTVTLLKQLDVHGEPRVIGRFFGPLGNHPLLCRGGGRPRTRSPRGAGQLRRLGRRSRRRRRTELAEPRPHAAPCTHPRHRTRWASLGAAPVTRLDLSASRLGGMGGAGRD